MVTQFTDGLIYASPCCSELTWLLRADILEACSWNNDTSVSIQI